MELWESQVDMLRRSGSGRCGWSEDDVAGEAEFARRLPFEGIFASLSDPEVFARVQIPPALGTLMWRNGADVDPDVLYAELSGGLVRLQPVPSSGPR